MVKRSVIQLYNRYTPIGNTFHSINVYHKGDGFEFDDIRFFMPLAKHIHINEFMTKAQIKETRPRLYKYAKTLAAIGNAADFDRAKEMLKSIGVE